jgi:hypothetical protein
MSTPTALGSATPADLGAAAAEIAGRYATVPPRETEATLAILALWALDAVESGRLGPEEADAAFVRLFLDITDGPGPEISEGARALLLEGMSLHDWGEDFGPDPREVRRLAFGILRRTGGAPA